MTVVIFSVFFLSSVVAYVAHIDGTCSYSWMPYNGTIPEDAISGGQDADGDPVYIALVHFKFPGESFAGMIVPSVQKAYTTYMCITYHAKNGPNIHIQILTSPNPDSFNWVVTKSSDLHLLTNYSLVVGGSYMGQPLYIGRVRHNGGIVLGKVYSHSLYGEGISVPSKRFCRKFKSFEVLSFDCKSERDNVIDQTERANTGISPRNKPRSE